MEKIEKLEITPVHVPSAARVGGECILPSDRAVVEKINEIIDRLNALPERAECFVLPTDSDSEMAEYLGKMYARQYRHNSDSDGSGEFVFSDSEIRQACTEMAVWKNKRAKLASEAVGSYFGEAKKRLASGMSNEGAASVFDWLLAKTNAELGKI